MNASEVDDGALVNRRNPIVRHLAATASRAGIAGAHLSCMTREGAECHPSGFGSASCTKCHKGGIPTDD